MNKQEIFTYLEERFGLDRKFFGGFEFLEASKGRIFITTKEAAKVVGGVRAVTAGLLFARVSEGWKPTKLVSSHLIKLSSNIAQLFGSKATNSVVDVEEEEAKKFIEGEDLEVQKADATQGYVIVKYKEYSLGIGLLKDEKIKNMLPKAKRIHVEL